MKKILKKFVNLFGYEIVNRKFFNPSAQYLANDEKFLWLNDKKFNQLYEEAVKVVGSNDFFPHKVRSYALVQLLNLVINKFNHYPVQNFVECGVAEGTTVYELCSVLKEYKKIDQKITFYAFDSFEGLSARQKEDIFNELVPEKSLPKEQIGSGKGKIAFSLERVKEGLKAFDFIEYHKGWIPESFKNLPDREYLFVHVDLDLYQPVLSAFEYFYPRLATGGIMVCDDYGFVFWPGAYKAVEEFSRKHNEPILRLPTGQAVIIKGAFKPPQNR